MTHTLPAAAFGTLMALTLTGCVGDLDAEDFVSGRDAQVAGDAATGPDEGGAPRDGGAGDASSGMMRDAGRDAAAQPDATDAGASAEGGHADADMPSQDAGGGALEPLSRDGWTLTAYMTDPAATLAAAIDGDLSTRWSSGALMTGSGEWVEVDLGSAYTFSRVILDTSGSDADFPVGYRFYVSEDASDFGAPLVESQDTNTVTTIEFDPQTARYIRIEQTGSKDSWWSIHELNVEGSI